MLSAWIKQHLHLKDIPGLEFVTQKKKGLVFRIPWARVGDVGWIEKWNVFIVSLAFLNFIFYF